MIQYETIEDVVQSLGVEEVSLSVREVIDGFASPGSVHRGACEACIDAESDGADLEKSMIQYIQDNPGKSCNAIFNHFKRRGFSHKQIVEIYDFLLQEREVIKRLNVGTDEFPRYAHFLGDFFSHNFRKDVLHDVLGPM